MKEADMTDQELAAIRERLAKATPGPWKTRTSFGLDRCEFEITEEGDGESYPYIIATAHGGIGYLNNVPTEGVPAANAALIANAPTDLAALLAEVDILRGLLADAALDGRPAYEAGVKAGRDRMRGEVVTICQSFANSPMMTPARIQCARQIGDAVAGLPSPPTTP